MEGLLLIAVLLPIALLVLMVVLLTRMSALLRELKETRAQLSQTPQGSISGEGTFHSSQPIIVPADVPPPPAAPVAPPIPDPIPEPIPEKEPEEVDDTAARLRELFPDPEETGSRTPPLDVVPHMSAATARVERERRPRSPSFFERHPDMERFIGENLINKIGIAVLVLGIGLLLRYAIGKGMISETGRTLIGLAAGGVLVFFGHRLRTGFRAFSSVLVAGGIAVFYSTIAIAFHQYELIGQTAAFIIMVVITGLAVALTLGYDRKELAVIALLGGFAAPFLVSTGEGNYRVLFTYLLILDVGMLVVANYKKWDLINVLSFALTALVMGAWAMDTYTGMEPRPALPAFGFASAFFLVFFAMNLRYNLRHRQVFTPMDHALLLVNTAAYYGVGLHFLGDLSVRITGLFTVLLGLFYLAFALYFHKREGVPQPLKLLLIGLVLTFISLAAPVQLEGSHITLFWAAEAVLLLWFAQRTGLQLVERASILVTVLMLLSLGMDLEQVYGWNAAETMRPLMNKGWVTGMVAGVALFLTHRLLQPVDGTVEMLPGLRRSSWSTITLVLAILVLYGINFLEQKYQLDRVVHRSVMHQAMMAYTLIFALALTLLVRKKNRVFRTALVLVLVLCGLVFIFGTYPESRVALRITERAGQGIGFLPFHLLALVAMVFAVVRVAVMMRELIGRYSPNWNGYLWAASTYIIILASQELDIAMILGRGTSTGLSDVRRVGYPLLWGVGSFIFMWYGMHTRLRTMRIIALTLFGITLLKLFLFDVWDLSEGGRVAAFIFLGVILLVVSFMYQRLKGLVIGDPPANEPADDGPEA